MNELEAIYAELPRIDCQGRCQESCGPIGYSALERQEMLALRGKTPRAQGPDLTCSALTPLGRCSVYERRPLICRLWGVAEGMPCPWGCKPERYVTKAEARKLLARVLDLSKRECGVCHVDKPEEPFA